jgi:Zn-dependent protease
LNVHALTLRFQLLRTPVGVHPFFWLLALLFGYMWAQGAPSVGEMWLRTVVGAGLVFVGVVAHEFGHAFAGRRYGRRPAIELNGWGGLTSWGGGARRLSAWREVWVSFAGPLVGIVLGGSVLLLQMFALPTVGGFVGWLLGAWVFVNLGWAIFNLLPIVPLDGGHIVEALATKRWGGRGQEGTYWLSFGLAVLLSIAGVFLGQLFLVVFFGYLAFTAWRQLQMIGAKNPFRWRIKRAPKKKPPTSRRRRDHGLEVLRGGGESKDDDRPRWLN